MKKILLGLGMMITSITGFSQASDLFISEYAEGSSNNKYIEIYNGTGDSVNLVNYALWRISNGGVWFEDSNIMSGWLYDGEVLVVANSSADTAILNLPNATTAYNTSTFYNGDDAVGLAKLVSSVWTLIDAVGKQGPDPGAGWDVAGTTNGTGEHTLVRKPNVCGPDTNWDTIAGTNPANSEWFVYAQNFWDSAGSHYMNCSWTPPPTPTLPEYPIATINTEDATGVADSLGVECWTRGVVVGVDLDGNDGYSFYIMDTLGGQVNGINVYSSVDVSGYQVQEGDSILLRGEVDQFNGLTEFVPDSIELLNQSNLLPDTMTIVSLSESTEAILVRFDNSVIIGSSFGNYTLVSGSDTIVMRVDSDTDIDDSLSLNVGDSLCFVVGIGAQFDNSSPYLGGYQVFPRYYTDLDTTCGPALTPQFTFITDDFSLMEESTATYEVVYTATNNTLDTASATVSVAGSSTATNGVDFSTISSVTFTVAPNSSDTDTITFTMIDDGANEGEETIVLNFSNFVNGTFGVNPELTISVSDDDVPFYPIPVINTDDANGEPDSMGVYCWTKGVVLGVDLDGNAGLSFTLWDNGGINIFNFVDVSNYAVAQGDSIMARGEIDFYNGLTELFVDSIVLINQSNPLPQPMVVSAPSQMTESNPIRINNVSVIDSTQWPSGGSSNVSLLTCDGDTITMRIDSDTDVDDNWASAPVGTFNVTGIGGQFDNSAPYLDNYQIFPMFGPDIDTNQTPAPSILINEIMANNVSAYADENGDFDDWIEVFNTGSNDIPLAGLYFTNDSQSPSLYQVPMSASEMVPAGGYAIIWADGEDGEGDLHTTFTLDAAGGFVGVSYMGGCEMTVADSITYVAMDSNQSYGRLTDGGTPWVIFSVSTPNAMNEQLA
ncbi:MAG: lamin tail domain-containing protein, partial [Cryomorphaceae bacterium]